MEDSQKRMIMAIVASFIFLMVWSKFFAPTPPSKPVESTERVENIEKEISFAPVNPQNQPETQSKTNLEEKQASKAVVNRSIITQLEKNEHFEARITNQGGVVDAWLLKQFKETKDDDALGVHVVPFALEAQAPLLWTLQAESSQNKITISDRDLTYDWVSFEQPYLLSNQDHQDLTIEKKFEWEPETFQLFQTYTIINQTNRAFELTTQAHLSSTQDPETQNRKGFLALFQAPKSPVRVLSYVADDHYRWDFEKIQKQKVEIPQGNVSWAGFESQYFLLNLQPKESLWDFISLKNQDDLTTITYHYPVRRLEAGSSLKYKVALYAGPKDIDVLTRVDETMKHGIDLGSWLGPIARLILKTLRMLYQWVHNYGVAIILLTIMVRLLLFPLAQKQAKSMKKMQVHKPAMDALKERYKDDREAYSRALMEYMKTNRINPAGGCLPLLFQFPIFIALYKVLYNSIELRHEPFVFWIQDLSAHDPFFVLPALVGITFFLQMKINPMTVGDPAQQAVMKIMPVMFSVLMIFLPSGLNLYIFVSTLWGIVQQYWVQKSNA